MTMQQAAMRTLMRAENNNIALDRSVFTRENFRRIGQFARPHTRRRAWGARRQARTKVTA